VHRLRPGYFQEASLEAELLRVATDERRRLAMDLHDSLCQQISATHFSLSAVSKQLTESDHTLAASVKKITLMVSAALDDARQIAHGLSPVMQDGDDIVRAVRRLVRNIEDLCQTQCRMHATQVFDDLHPDVASQLYHIAQEALNNVLRHADATAIEVTLAREDHDVVLTVSDNGIGLSALTNQDAGRGIRFMRYRAGTIHGSLKLVRKKEGGMAVVCRVPYRTS
jgi:two-component system sensor histidine kinase DegS